MSVFKNDGLLVEQYNWEFSEDGGATGALALDAKEDKPVTTLPAGALVMGVVGYVKTAVTSGGSLTAEWGDNSDPDGYSGSAIAVAALTVNSVFNGHDNGAALLWDDTNDHAIYSYVDGSTKDGSFDFTINTAAATAGIMEFRVLYLMVE